MITCNNRHNVIYKETPKVMFGNINTSVLFWMNISVKLKKLGFKLNLHDRFLMNKKIDGKHCNILWHANNIKFSHVDPNLVTNLLKRIVEKCSKEFLLMLIRGKVK